MKLNIKLLENRKLGIKNILDEDTPGIVFNCIKCKQNKQNIRLYTEKSYIEIPIDIFLKMLIRKNKDTIWLIYENDNNINSLVGYTLFDTYGFPVEITQEELKNKGNLDLIGFDILKEIQKEKSQNKKIESAF